MAPKRGKETPLELCTSIIAQGNSIAVHILEYLSDSKTPRTGFRELAVEFLNTSRSLFPTRAGLTGAAQSRTQLPADSTNELQELLRQYEVNFSVLKQMVNKLLDNEKKQGFGKIGKGFRMMFADTDMEKMTLSLGQCREAARKNALVFTWVLDKVTIETTANIGYTALAAVLDRPDPTVIVGKLNEAQIVPKGHPAHALPRTDSALTHSYGTPRERREVLSPTLSESAIMYRASSISTVRDAKTSFNAYSSFADDASIHTLPTPPLSVEEAAYAHHLAETVPKQAVRVAADPTAAPRWRPKRSNGALPPGSKAALLTAVQEQNHKMLEQLLDCGASTDNGPERNLLILAVAHHDMDSVRLLLLFGADANAKDIDGLTPLYAATEAMFLEAAQLLLRYGADPDLPAGQDEETPFAQSLSSNKAQFAQLYLKHGADPDATTAGGETAFIQAMNKSTAANLVELMLVYDAKPNNKNGHGETALFRAINAERLDLVVILLEHGADPNLPGPKHMLWPAVHRPQMLKLLLEKGANLTRAPGVLELATSINSLEAVNVLLKHGCDPNAKKDGIFTPLCTAIRDNRGDLLEILLKAGADPNLPASEYPAFKCVTHHRTQFLPRLIAAGADPNTPKGIIETAVAHKDKDALAMLLGQRIDANARNAAGHTALTTAIRMNDIHSVTMLVSEGADPGVRGHEWPINMAVKTPDILAKLLPHISAAKIPKGALELAVQADKLESVKLLLAKGVDVEEKNGGVFSPLTTSIREDCKDIFRFLLDEAGADPNSPGEHLPIIKAIRRHRENDHSYIKHLIASGADINLMYRGWNAVLQALDKGDTQTLRLLADLGTPDLNARDEDGNSVLDIMRERGMKEEERILLGGGSPSPRMKEAFSSLREFVKVQLE
ncbi:hypothetical protein LTR56_003226 [Elasticomyces elasticus]|nr:hypothetical protein LTR22_017796 [Elasticomyces elasticus]KAK3656094.1 hypothetical protein LTR56_003226 [Elasticomyces elasticus]